MKRSLVLLICCISIFYVKAQQPVTKTYQPYGKVDKEDLELKECEFEKDANAEILFDKGVWENGQLDKHIRIKIFNALGVGRANVSFKYVSFMGMNDILSLKGETINYENGKIVIIPLDKKQIYTQRVDRFFSSVTFALPNVKAGSIIEYQFSVGSVPEWFFQSDLPTRYSEIEISFPGTTSFKYIPHINQPFFKSKGAPSSIYQVKALTNIRSLPNEPYMGARHDNLQRMEYEGVTQRISSWKRVGELLVQYYEFGGQFNRSLAGEDDIIKQAAGMPSKDEKIACIFDRVKANMAWNNITSFQVTDGTSAAWDKKTGNSAEINLILYHLLKKAGIDAYPMVVSTKNNGKINPFNVDVFSFNNTVVYVPLDMTNPDDLKYYVLDACNKYNLFNEVPQDNLNSFGLQVDKAHDDSKPIFLQNTFPVLHSIFVNAEIKPDGQMDGEAHLNSYGYNRVNELNIYKTKGEDKYKDYLKDDDNSIKISSLKLSNMQTDSLPLSEDISFKLDLTGTDDNYIYFDPVIFFSPHKNPFLNETRYSDIDFGYLDRVSFNGIFKVPAGYKIDALPKSVSLIMPDTSITFRRIINEQDGTIVVRYTIYHKKTMYFQQDYPDFYAFYKKIYEMLNEQIVLKKS